MQKLKVMQRLLDHGIIAVIRADCPEKALKIATAVNEGGIKVIEITLTVPGAIDVINKLTKLNRDNEIIIGAGTVLGREEATATIMAGAQFIVSPHLDPEVIKVCNRYQKISMAGAMTVKEIIEVMEAGTDFVKLFPANTFGPDAVKSFKGPLPQAPIIPTGGVNLKNISEWFQAGVEAVGVGGELTRVDGENYSGITEIARKYVAAVKSGRAVITP